VGYSLRPSNPGDCFSRGLPKHIIGTRTTPMLRILRGFKKKLTSYPCALECGIAFFNAQIRRNFVWARSVLIFLFI